MRKRYFYIDSSHIRSMSGVKRESIYEILKEEVIEYKDSKLRYKVKWYDFIDDQGITQSILAWHVIEVYKYKRNIANAKDI